MNFKKYEKELNKAGYFISGDQVADSRGDVVGQMDPYGEFHYSDDVMARVLCEAAQAEMIAAVVPANFDSEITLLVCTNGAATNNINVQVYHADGTEYHYLLRAHSVAGNDAYNVLTSNRLFLHSGDKIVAYKAGGTFDVSVSGKQFFNPTRT